MFCIAVDEDWEKHHEEFTYGISYDGNDLSSYHVYPEQDLDELELHEVCIMSCVLCPVCLFG